MKASILGLGLTAPGLVNFEQFKALMAENKTPELSEPLEKYSPSFLPANERRRTTATIKLALKTAEQAWNSFKEANPKALTQVPVLFVSKDGDTLNSAKICQALSENEPMISPTQFHNSVHNAPAGYWMIGQNNHAPASAISAGMYAVANGLLEAVLQSQQAKTPVLVVFYDLPVDQAIASIEADSTDKTNKTPSPFAFAMVLDASQKEGLDTCPSLSLILTSIENKLELADNPYQGLPAAQAYPLLKKIALLSTENINHDMVNFEMTFPLNDKNFVKVTLNGTS